jgi:hypothetical protein
MPEGAPHSSLLLRAILTCVLQETLLGWIQRGLLLALPPDPHLAAQEVPIPPFIWVDDIIIHASSV